MKRLKQTLMIYSVMILGFLTLFLGRRIPVQAKSAAPNITFSITNKSKKEGKVQIRIKVEDPTGLRTVKYAEGSHRNPYFRYAFYEKGVKKVKVTSSKKISFSLDVKEGSTYTLYSENKKGKSSHKIIFVTKKSSERKEENEKMTNENTKGESGTVQSGENSNGSSNTGNTSSGTPNEEPSGGLVPPTPSVPDQGQGLDAFNINNEIRAVWVTFLEFSKGGYNESTFRNKIRLMFDDIAERRMNTVYMHVRPFSDAMYRSNYFPWSVYASGKEGKDPGFDPLAIMVEEAHSRGLKLHAYINPYRVNFRTKFEALKNDSGLYKWKNPAFQWLNDTDEENDRNVLRHGDKYYYNPSKQEVIDLITNGVREICENYDVDGIIFDDYFYPNLGLKYDENFDADEYYEYELECDDKGISPLSIPNWRRENINKMVRSVYGTVKAAGKGQTFGISPAGNLNNLRSNYTYYVDIDRWGRESGFVDYLAPQLYWGFENKAVPFEQNVRNWMNVVRNPNTKLYIALAAHNVQAQESAEWKKRDILARMLNSLREKNLGGFSVYRYDFITDAFLTKRGAKEARDALFDLIR